MRTVTLLGFTLVAKALRDIGEVDGIEKPGFIVVIFIFAMVMDVSEYIIKINKEYP